MFKSLIRRLFCQHHWHKLFDNMYPCHEVSPFISGQCCKCKIISSRLELIR